MTKPKCISKGRDESSVYEVDLVLSDLMAFLRTRSEGK
jgi:hypothetical protein